MRPTLESIFTDLDEHAKRVDGFWEVTRFSNTECDVCLYLAGEVDHPEVQIRRPDGRAPYSVLRAVGEDLAETVMAVNERAATVPSITEGAA